MAVQAIDRRALVDRHRVVMRGLDPRSPLSVGNGELCFTADLTGLQTFPDSYPVGPRDREIADGTLLGTYAQWGWHSEPTDPEPELADSLVEYASPHGPVSYVDLGGSISEGTESGTPEGEIWLRGNPHRLHLGLIGLAERTDTGLVDLDHDDIDAAEQTLDLWRGLLTSGFDWRGRRVAVTTCCDPELDRLAITIDSAALSDDLAIRLRFPYGSQDWHNGADWDRPQAHRTAVQPAGDHQWLVHRRLDGTDYRVLITVSPGVTVEQRQPHDVQITGTTGRLELVLDFLDADTDDTDAEPVSDLPEARPATVQQRAADAGVDFWTTGGAVDLSAVADPRAAELERRIVLSQYLTKINCSGSLPPAETGLVCNSWRGKFHLEMHWWHGAHFPLWGRPDLLRRSLGWYASVLPQARETAHRQGFRGARWPKQVGPEARESPSTIGPFLIWQQPHPIYLAELVYRADPDPSVLEELAEVVFETAAFMVDYPSEADGVFHLGPPLIPAQESYGGIRAEVIDPTYELVYWHWALTVANRWRTRLGLPIDTEWQHVADNLARPTVRGDTYTAIGLGPWTIRTDHPSMLCALGVLPETSMINTDVMATTLDSVLAAWDWDTTWGWDYPVIAMCAARLGRPEQAVDALLMGQHKNTALPNGHNRQSSSLPLYLPGNGGLLAAVALMAGGWDLGPQRATPGFPADWPVRAEGLVRAP